MALAILFLPSPPLLDLRWRRGDFLVYYDEVVS